MKNKIAVIVSIVICAIIIVFSIINKKSYSLTMKENINILTLNRINEIRNTSNTDVSKIKGKIYYVSTSGNDNNNGLSESTPIKTIEKLNTLMSSKTIKNGDAVLFKRGDTFRGNVVIKDHNITFGSYGNTSLSKPKIYGSKYNAAKEGSWKQVYTNIWKYQYNNQDETFQYDIGSVWFFCTGSNSNCTRTTTDGQTKYSFGKKITTYSNVEESETLVKTLLKNDLDFYHMGHSYYGKTTGGALYVYSVSNPSSRFDDIEISLGRNGFNVASYSNIVIDNLNISYFGRSGIGSDSNTNLTISNCEISYIGGMTQKYNATEYWPLRFGNGLEIYGNIMDANGFTVDKGFVVKNNYIYEIYDAGMSFQYTAPESKTAIVERVEFDNNVVENCSYNIEYWNDVNANSTYGYTEASYINKAYFTNNILRNAGVGITETRPEHGYEALIKTWDKSTEAVNKLKEDGEFIIENNILDTTGSLPDNNGNLVGTYMIHITAANEKSLPIVRNNQFYNYKNKNLGYFYSNDTYKALIPFNEQLTLNDGLLKDNTFVVYDGDGLLANITTEKPDPIVTLNTVNDVNLYTMERINEIRNTPNTDTSKVTGNIYYVANNGNDNNNGLSANAPLKTVTKVNALMKNGQIPEGSAILFRDGDIFRDNVLVARTNKVLIGSYGDITKGKPTLTASTYDGAKDGTWIEVKPNIWKYTYNNSDLVFNHDVGTIWFFCNSGNNNCTKTMESEKRKFEYATKISTKLDFDESNIDNIIDTLLTHDLEFYHAGHSGVGRNIASNGTKLYVYSTSNPATRFNEIEFAVGNHIIRNQVTSLYIDNLNLLYTGAHGVSSSSTSNLVTTNLEVGYIGGSGQNYDNNSTIERFGNGIEIYGSVIDMNGDTVREGFVIDNCYVYQVYDAGITFQYTSKDIAYTDKAIFTNNVLEYSNYNVEYWETTTSTNQSDKDATYINDFLIENNVMRYAAEGLCETRPNHGKGSHIILWVHSNGYSGVLRGNNTVKNNIFMGSNDHYYTYKTKSDNYPVVEHNLFIGDSNDSLGYFENTYYAKPIAFDEEIILDLFPNNRVIQTDKANYVYNNGSGVSGDTTWSYNKNTNTLSITGTGRMADYTESNLPPWYQYKESIHNIEIGENVTYLGKYAFYNLDKVISLRINSASLENLSADSSNGNYGNNYTFTNVGSKTRGLTLTFGPNVTKVPKMLTKPTDSDDEVLNFNRLEFEGNKVTSIQSYGLANSKQKGMVLPDSITSIASMGTAYARSYITIMPRNLKTINDYVFNGDTYLEKVVFGPEITTINSKAFRRCNSLKTIVLPKITNTSAVSETLSSSTEAITVYGGDGVEEWVNNVKAANSSVNITYKPISEYKSHITSNTIIDSQVSYDSSFLFTTEKNAKAYYVYTNKHGARFTIGEVKMTRTGNNYIISNIRSDIYIEVEEDITSNTGSNQNALSGTSNEVTWNMNLNTYTLTISGTGKMADYTASSLAPWSQYSSIIKNIEIGENVTYLGKYAFYNLEYAQNIYLNAKNLSSLVSSTNNTFTNLGRKTTGAKLIIGANVESIPAYLTNSTGSINSSPYITNIEFKGSKLKTIGNYGLSYTFVDELMLPESIETLGEGSFLHSKTLKFLSIPSKVTKLSKKLVKNSQNLETVVIGTNVTSSESEALGGLPKLSKVVVLNSSLTLTSSVLDNYNKRGLQIYSPSQNESFVTTINTNESSTVAYYIPLTSYRPIVYGDKNTFYVTHDELKYNNSGTYNAKALANASVNLSGAKYRYIDRFGTKHLMDGVNINTQTKTITNAIIDIELIGTISNKDNKVIDKQTVLYLGNSLTTGLGTHSLTSTTVTDDYVYYVTKYLKSLNNEINIQRYKMNTWENKTTTEERQTELNTTISTLNKAIKEDYPVKTIFLQFGDNIDTDAEKATFRSDLDTYIKRIKQEYPSAKVYFVYGRYVRTDVESVIKEIASSNNIEYIDITILKTSSRYQSYMGAKYFNQNGFRTYVTESGVASHPGDYGFITMADIIIDYLKSNMNSQTPPPSPEITSNNYNVNNKKVFARPTTQDYKKNELTSNISANTTYEIYDSSNNKVSTNANVGTGYKIKIGTETYDIIVLGDVTGDGKISLGDLSKLYNHYKKKLTLTGSFLEAGKINGGSKVSLGDISKLYNFYKGKLSIL